MKRKGKGKLGRKVTNEGMKEVRKEKMKAGRRKTIAKGRKLRRKGKEKKKGS